MTHISTQEVASQIDVAETTIKPWADEGKIPCHRTLGGHRKFLMKDIVHFADEFQCDRISTSIGEAVDFLKDRFDLRPGPSKKR